MAKKARSLKRTILESYRRVKETDADRLDNFDHSLANSMIASTPLLIYDAQQFLNTVGQVHSNLLNRRGVDGGPVFTGRQKEVIAFCLYIEQRGEICILRRGEDGTPVAQIINSDDPRANEAEKQNFCNALCLLNDIERREPDESVDEFIDSGANYAEDHAQAINVGGEINLDADDDDELTVADPKSEPESKPEPKAKKAPKEPPNVPETATEDSTGEEDDSDDIEDIL